MSDRLDEITKLLRAEEQGILQQLEERAAEVARLQEQLARTRRALEDLRASAPSPSAVHATAPAPDHLYLADDLLLGELVQYPRDGVRMHELRERLAKKNDAGRVASGLAYEFLLQYFCRPAVNLVEQVPSRTPRSGQRYRLTSRGLQYHSCCQQGKRAEALVLLPPSQFDDARMEQDTLLQLPASGPSPEQSWLTLPELRVYLLLTGGYGGDLGPRLMAQLPRLLAAGLIRVRVNAREIPEYQLTEQGRQLHKPELAELPELGSDRELRGGEVLRGVAALQAADWPATLPAILRELRDRYRVESLPTVEQLRAIVDRLRSAKLVRSTSRRLKDPETGDEVWQDYALTARGRAKLDANPPPER